MTKKKTIRQVIKDPFDEFNDIGNEYRFTETPLTVLSEYENKKKNTVPEGSFFPVNPYDKRKITQKATSLGRMKKTYSLSSELVLRIDLLNTRIKQDRRECGRGTRGCSTSRLIEEGMRYVLKKYRYKYNDLGNENKE